MSFKPCILIPIYNHHATISLVVGKLAAYGLPILIIDDGSDEATQRILAALAQSCVLVQLYRLPVNSGKGAAVMHGMQHAHASGFSHALQIDADGQHELADVPCFLEAGRQHPLAVICGKPVYDASVPKGRLYGRYVTHFWVWIETLSFSIADSMCGFRLYPLAATCTLMQQVSIPRRMDFDIAIVVHLSWQGLQFHNIPTRVIYPPDGISHFRMLADNFNISKTHSKLFFGMLRRLPTLLRRKFASTTNKGQHWSKMPERGSSLGMKCIAGCYRLLGKPIAILLLYPIIAYFLLTNRTARQASQKYLTHWQQFHGSHHQMPQPGWAASYRHMLAFGHSSLDKLGAWMGERIDASFSAQAEMEALLASGQGAMLVGAHLGNLEMLRAMASLQHKATINAVVYTEHAQKFNQLLASSNPRFQVNLLQVSSFGPDTAIMLKEKIDQGELLVIVGDRTPPAENGRISTVSFLGHPAPFAQGPWLLASLLECPIYLLFCLKQDQRYHIHFEQFADSIKLPRQERQAAMNRYIQRYAQRLEYYCGLAPLEWFNFYDFWAGSHKENAAPPQPKTTPSI